MRALQIEDFRFLIELREQAFRNEEKVKNDERVSERLLLRDREFLPRSGYGPEPRVASTLGKRRQPIPTAKRLRRFEHQSRRV